MTDFTCPNIENQIIRSCGKQIMALGKKPGNASIMLLWSVLLVKATTDLQEVFVSSTPLHKRKSNSQL
jgi:hypothetical protein